MNQTPHTLAELSRYFHLPINDVAKELGVCATVLKKICRKNGITRWPHRKIKSLARMIETLESITPASAEDAASLKAEIASLEEKKRYLMQNPNVSYKAVVPKYCASACQSRVQRAQMAAASTTPVAPGKQQLAAATAGHHSTAGSKRSHAQAFRKSRQLNSFDDDYDTDEEYDYQDDDDDSSYDEEYGNRSSKRQRYTSPTPPARPTLQQQQQQQHATAAVHHTNTSKPSSLEHPLCYLERHRPAADDGVVPIPSSTAGEVDAASILLAFSQPETPRKPVATSLSAQVRASESRKKHQRSELYTSSDAVACINSLPTLQLKPEPAAPASELEYHRVARTSAKAAAASGDSTARQAPRSSAYASSLFNSADNLAPISLPPLKSSSLAMPALPTLPPLSQHLGYSNHAHSVPNVATSPQSSPAHRSPPSSPSQSSDAARYRHHPDSSPSPYTPSYDPTRYGPQAPNKPTASTRQVPELRMSSAGDANQQQQQQQQPHHQPYYPTPNARSNFISRPVLLHPAPAPPTLPMVVEPTPQHYERAMLPRYHPKAK
jgi:hypothetical protein